MFHVLIPARHASTRLPGKPLKGVGGRPLIQWTWERACRSGAASVIIATDDERIRDAAIGFGAQVVMTSPAHASGTDRIAEAVRARGLGADDIVVNVQGDEPLIEPPLIAALAAALEARPRIDIATAAAPIRNLEEFLDANCVKVLLALDGRALYFSRAPVPWPRDDAAGGRPAAAAGACRHIGIYAYRVRGLLQFAAWPPTELERIERLEQLRALEHGMNIHVLTLDSAPPPGVDTPEDLERLRTFIAAG
jgi:3-deoxy-manno-octulosonate cytidylyltransferase (CMP-KDO synthetase)